MQTHPSSNSDAVKHHVFLIDDDELIRHNLAITLQDAGYEVQVFETAVDFLNANLQQTPAVILTDMVMPNMTGIELQAELNRRSSFIPLVLMSGESSVSQSVTAMKQGAIEFLVKPFDKKHLMETIARGIQIHARKMHVDQLVSQLTPRERQVLQHLLKGYGNAELVSALGISLPTVKQYKSEVMRKLGLESYSDLIRLMQ